MDKTFITDLKVQSLIGIHPYERAQKRGLILQITLYHDTSLAGSTDHIEDCINYQDVTEEIIRYANASERLTVEAFAEDVAGLCIANFKVDGICVRVDKPGAVEDARSVGVEIERFRGNIPIGQREGG